MGGRLGEWLACRQRGGAGRAAHQDDILSNVALLKTEVKDHHHQRSN